MDFLRRADFHQLVKFIGDGQSMTPSELAELKDDEALRKRLAEVTRLYRHGAGNDDMVVVVDDLSDLIEQEFPACQLRASRLKSSTASKPAQAQSRSTGTEKMQRCRQLR